MFTSVYKSSNILYLDILEKTVVLISTC